MQSECFGGKDDDEEEEEEDEASKRILRSPGITPDGCTSAVRVGMKDSELKKAGSRNCTYGYRMSSCAEPR